LRHEGFRYALDNGAWAAFQQHARIDLVLFAHALDTLGASADWCVVPDIVAGGRASLLLSTEWLPRVLNACPYALVAVQDGLTPDDVVPFLGERVGIFIGGSTAWKEQTLPQWGKVARAARCWCHVGRVNSARRIYLCSLAGVTSFDGSSGSRYAVTIPMLNRARNQLSLFGGNDARTEDLA
jgi:hypothetical protein